MSSTLKSIWKKHRHRVGLAYFVCGLAVGLLFSFFPRSGAPPSSPIRSASSKLETRQLECATSCGVGNGWNVVNVFYGATDHIKFNSMINNDYFDRVKWYSQARQDEVVAALLRNKRNGYFIDLASNDPVKISNTYALETFFDWKGLCLEPNPAYWAGLSYRKCDTVGAVVGANRMEEVHFRFPNRNGPMGGIVGKDYDNKESSKFDEDRPRYTIPLLEIFQRFNTPKVIDYMSLDVEGAEELVMKGFPFDEYRFNIITLERPSDSLKALLTQHGYQFQRLLKRNSGDTLWIHKSMDGQLDTEAACKIETMKIYQEMPTKRVKVSEEKDNYCED